MESDVDGEKKRMYWLVVWVLENIKPECIG